MDAAFSQLQAVEEVCIPFDEEQQICPAEVFNAFFLQTMSLRPGAAILSGSFSVLVLLISFK